MTRALRMVRTVVAVHACLAFTLPVALCLGEHRLHRNKTNAFQVFDILPDGVAIYTSSNDPSLKCMTADRIEYKPNRKVVYTWNLLSVRGSKRDTYHVEYYPGPTQDTVFAIFNHEWKRPFLVKLYYTNNKNCVVANLPYKGKVCMLWVPRAYASSFPQECIDRFEDLCYAQVPAYQEGLCDDARGNY